VESKSTLDRRGKPQRVGNSTDGGYHMFWGSVNTGAGSLPRQPESEDSSSSFSQSEQVMQTLKDATWVSGSSSRTSNSSRLSADEQQTESSESSRSSLAEITISRGADGREYKKSKHRRRSRKNISPHHHGGQVTMIVRGMASSTTSDTLLKHFKPCGAMEAEVAMHTVQGRIGRVTFRVLADMLATIEAGPYHVDAQQVICESGVKGIVPATPLDDGCHSMASRHSRRAPAPVGYQDNPRSGYVSNLGGGSSASSLAMDALSLGPEANVMPEEHRGDPEAEARWELHIAGKCSPCYYMSRRESCKKGKDCDFCHLPHVVQETPRPCKAKRAQCKRIADYLDQLAANNPTQFDETALDLLRQGGYLSVVVRSKLKSMNRRVEDLPDGSICLEPSPGSRIRQAVVPSHAVIGRPRLSL